MVPRPGAAPVGQRQDVEQRVRIERDRVQDGLPRRPMSPGEGGLGPVEVQRRLHAVEDRLAHIERKLDEILNHVSRRGPGARGEPTAAPRRARTPEAGPVPPPGRRPDARPERRPEGRPEARRPDAPPRVDTPDRPQPPRDPMARRRERGPDEPDGPRPMRERRPESNPTPGDRPPPGRPDELPPPQPDRD
jgi:hypothetical protein